MKIDVNLIDRKIMFYEGILSTYKEGERFYQNKADIERCIEYKKAVTALATLKAVKDVLEPL